MTGESICGGTLYLPSREEELYRKFDHCTGNSVAPVSQLIAFEPRSISRSSYGAILGEDDSSLMTPSKLRISGDVDIVCDMNSRRDGSDNVKALLHTINRNEARNIKGDKHDMLIHYPLLSAFIIVHRPSPIAYRLLPPTHTRIFFSLARMKQDFKKRTYVVVGNVLWNSKFLYARVHERFYLLFSSGDRGGR